MKRSLIVIIWAVLTITGVHSQNIYPNHKKEYSAIFEVGYGKDITYGKEDKFGFLTSHGINVTPTLFTGLGFGLEYYKESEATVIPVYFDMRAKLFNKDFTPFIGMKTGYSFNDAEGWYLSPSVGYKLKSFHIALGYTLQYIDTKWADLKHECLSFKFGYTF